MSIVDEQKIGDYFMELRPLLKEVFPKHQTLTGIAAATDTTAQSIVVLLIPHIRISSGIKDPLTDKDVPIGQLRLQADNIEDLQKKVEHLISLFK